MDSPDVLGCHNAVYSVSVRQLRDGEKIGRTGLSSARLAFAFTDFLHETQRIVFDLANAFSPSRLLVP